MNCCAGPPGIDAVFDARLAGREARRFERRGLPARALRLLDGIRTGLPATASLEVGGGTGGLSLTLLREGVDRATLVDPSTAYIAQARRLASATGLSARIDIRHGAYPGAAPEDAVDLIVLDRVVCCDPDWQGLLRPAARQARHMIALSYPRSAWWTALLVRAVNAGLRLMRETFRMQHHDPEAMHALLREAGFEPRVIGHYWMWELVVATR